MIYVYGTVKGDPTFFFGTIDVQGNDFVFTPEPGRLIANRRLLKNLTQESVMTRDGLKAPRDMSKTEWLALLPKVYSGVGLRCLTEPDDSEEVEID